jgi:hypothetical protein
VSNAVDCVAEKFDGLMGLRQPFDQPPHVFEIASAYSRQRTKRIGEHSGNLGQQVSVGRQNRSITKAQFASYSDGIRLKCRRYVSATFKTEYLCDGGIESCELRRGRELLAVGRHFGAIGD